MSGRVTVPVAKSLERSAQEYGFVGKRDQPLIGKLLSAAMSLNELLGRELNAKDLRESITEGHVKASGWLASLFSNSDLLGMLSDEQFESVAKAMTAETTKRKNRK